MPYFQVFLLGLVLIGASYAFMYYLQPGKKYKVNIKLENITSKQIMYKQYLGSYQDIKAQFEVLINFILEYDEKNPQKIIKMQDTIEQHFGLFYDDPNSLANEAEARAIYGFVIPEKIDKDLREEITKVFGHQEGFKQGILPSSNGLHGQLPNQEYYFYLLRSLEFEPVFKGDQLTIRQKYGQYMKNMEKGNSCQLELYDKDNIHFYLPLENLDQFKYSQYQRGK